MLAGHFSFDLYISIFRKVSFVSVPDPCCCWDRERDLSAEAWTEESPEAQPRMFILVEANEGLGRERRRLWIREEGTGGDWKTELEGEIGAEKKREMGDVWGWWGLGSRGRKKRRNMRQNVGK